jgi:hypothetical protein
MTSVMTDGQLAPRPGTGVLDARPWKEYGLVRGLKAPPRRIRAPAAATASAVSMATSRLSIEHGPAMTVSEPSPMRTSPTSMTVSSGWNSRLASWQPADGRHVRRRIASKRLMSAACRGPTSPTRAMTTRSVPGLTWGCRPSARIALLTALTSASVAAPTSR